jgi:hypothetical protein
MENIKFLIGLLFIVIGCPPVFAEVTSTQDFSVTSYHVSGNTANSFYPRDKATFLYDGKVNFDGQLKDKELFGSISYRATNDRLVDVQNASIENMFIGLKKPGWEILAGDFYSNFSDYTFGNALKGLKLESGTEDSLHFKIAGGVDTAKWEDFWEKHAENSGTRRHVWGAQAGDSFLDKKLKLNINYAGYSDDKAFLSSSGTPALVNVGSLSGSYKINSILNSTFEAASSFTDTDRENNKNKTKNDSAYKAALDLNTTDYTLTSAYSRAGYNFNSAGGFSSKDLEAVNFDGIWFLPKRVKFTHYLHLDRDNLSNRKTTTTKQTNPGCRFNFNLPWEITGDAGFDLRKRFATDRETKQKTYTYSTNLSRDLRIFYLTSGYTRTIVSDMISPSQERVTDTYSVGFDGDFTIKKIKINWGLTQDFNHDQYGENQGVDFTIARSARLRFSNLPGKVSAEAKVTIGDNNYYTNSSDSNTDGYLIALSKPIRDNLNCGISWEHKGYRYADQSKDYGETLIKGKLSCTF